MTPALPELPVIRTLGGCGGTLLSRLFGALPRTVVLSETNPRSANLFGGHLNPLRQLRQWHPVLLEDVAEFDDAEIGYPPRFGEMLQGIRDAAIRYGYRLILRDFSYADFIGIPFIWPAAAESSLDAALAGRLMPRSIILVRHPAKQLASLRTHRALEHVLMAERYVEGALTFLSACCEKPVFRYEDLMEHPEHVFRDMCTALDVPFEAAALTGFTDVITVTGSLARAAESRIAAGPPAPGTARAQAELDLMPGYAALLAKLGYTA